MWNRTREWTTSGLGEVTGREQAGRERQKPSLKRRVSVADGDHVSELGRVHGSKDRTEAPSIVCGCGSLGMGDAGTGAFPPF